jgi:hypothetical protein
VRAGLQTTGAWLIFSQGFLVATSLRVATSCCDAYLEKAVQQLLASASAGGGGSSALLPEAWLRRLASADPGLLCQAGTLGLQVSALKHLCAMCQVSML